jgi:hypothetical protein
MGLFFVGGFLRSGTTMLQTIIFSSPECNPMIGEAIFLRSIVETYWRCKVMFDTHSKYYFSDKEDLRQYCGKFISDFVRKTSDNYNNPKHIVLKHPQLTPYFPLLHELAQEARFVIIVRDPRDMVASAISAKARGAGEFQDTDPQQIAKSLIDYYAPCVNCKLEKFRRNTIYVKYEDLVQSPHQVVGALQEFTGIDLSNFNPNMENIRTEIKFDEKRENRRPLHSKYYGKGITSERVGRFSGILDTSVILDIENICKPMLETFNYTS